MSNIIERLKDDDGESFGLSRTAYASRRKMQLRVAARIARDRNRATVITLPQPQGTTVHEPSSPDAIELGIRSYTVEMPERESVIGRQIRCFGGMMSVSLPYVSILGASA